MLQVKACNIGFRPIILTKFVAVGNKSAFCMGTDDEPAAAYGIEDQKFPSIIDPGMTLTFHPMTIAALEQNAIDPKNSKTFYDPFIYLILVDSFERFHHMNMRDVRWELHLDQERRPINWRSKIIQYFQRKYFFRKARRRILQI